MATLYGARLAGVQNPQGAAATAQGPMASAAPPALVLTTRLLHGLGQTV